MAPMGVSQFERFLRAAASLDVDKDDPRSPAASASPAPSAYSIPSSKTRRPSNGSGLPGLRPASVRRDHRRGKTILLGQDLQYPHPLGPRVHHPILVFLAVIAGGQIAGVLGVIFAVPALAMLKVLFDFSRVRLQTEEARAVERRSYGESVEYPSWASLSRCAGILREPTTSARRVSFGKYPVPCHPRDRRSRSWGSRSARESPTPPAGRP